MTISKKTQYHNNMLFMLASLACGQNDSSSSTSTAKQPMPPSAAVSDTSDDDTSTMEVTSPEKEVVVARRRRRPIKKRIPMGDYRSSSSLLPYLSSSVKPRKSLLETSIDIVCNSPRTKRDMPTHVECRDEQPILAPEQESQDNESHEADKEMSTLVCDDKVWKLVHSPLDLPLYLPCPAVALRVVNSIYLTLEER